MRRECERDSDRLKPPDRQLTLSEGVEGWGGKKKSSRKA